MHALYTSARCISCASPPGYCRCASAMHLRIAASRPSPCCAVCVTARRLASITATNAPRRPSENFPGHIHGLFPQCWLLLINLTAIMLVAVVPVIVAPWSEMRELGDDHAGRSLD